MLYKNIFGKRKINPWRHLKRFIERYCFGIGSGLDPDSIRSVDLDSDSKFYVLKCYMFSLKGWRLPVYLKVLLVA